VAELSRRAGTGLKTHCVVPFCRAAGHLAEIGLLLT